MSDIEQLRRRIQQGERIFKAEEAPLLHTLAPEMKFVVEPADDRPPLNKRGKSVPQKCVRIRFTS